MESLLKIAKQARDNIASTVLEKIFTYEQANNLWLGEDIIVEYMKQLYLVKGLNDDQNNPVKVMPIDFRLFFKDKQTKGSEGEKEKS